MATLATNVSFQCFGLDGKPLAGGKVYTYSAGTTTNKATYTTMTGFGFGTVPAIVVYVALLVVVPAEYV